VSGASTFDLTYQWANFTAASPRSDTISVLVTYADSSTASLSYSFNLWGTNSAAYSSTPPTSASTWASILTPDQLSAGQQTVGAGPYASLGLADGSVQTSHSMPSYNPNVPGLDLTYSSSAADPLPVFLVHYLIPTGQAAPPTVSAQLTLNGVAGSTTYWSTSTANPGDILQLALQGQSGLATGRYSWWIGVTANYTGNPQTTNYSGSVDIVNDSSSAFGAGWSLDNVERLWPVSGGVILEEPGGASLWFASNGQGGYTTPPGDFSTLTLSGGTYTRTMPDGTQINFNSSGYETRSTDRDGNVTALSWNPSNQLVSITDMNGQAVQLGYTGSHVTSFTDPANRVTNLSFTGSQLTGITDPDTASWSYAYNTGKEMTGLTDPNSHTTSFTFTQGQATGVTRADNTTESLTAVQGEGLPASGTGTQSNPAPAVLAALATANYTDPNSQVWSTALDWLGFGLVTSAADPLADTTLSYRDPNGLDWLDTDPLGRRTREFFDSKGNPTTIAYPDDTTDQYTYNSFSEPTQHTNPLGGVTQNNYNSKGDLTQTIDPLNHMTAYSYNTAGLATSMTDANQHTTSYAFDAYNRQTQTTDALQNHVTNAYDSASNLTSTTDQLGFTSTYQYDAMGRLTQQTLPDTSTTSSTTAFAYDKAGNETKVTDPLGNSSTMAYDAMNRETLSTDAMSASTHFYYDNAGNETKVTDPMGFSRTSSFDAAGRLTASTDPLNHTTSYTLDAAGEQTAVTNPLGKTWQYTFTLRGQVATVTDPNTNQAQSSYDAGGDQTGSGEAVLQNGVYVTIFSSTQSYNADQQLTQTTDMIGKSSTYAYDQVGNLLTVSGPAAGGNSSLTYAYDALNRQTSVTDGQSHTTQSAYDAAGNVTAVTNGLNYTTSYTFDAQHRELTQTSALNGTTTWAYDLAGNNTSITDPVSNRTVMAYDKDGRLTSQANPMGYTATSSYDLDGRLTSTTDANGRQSNFGYDNAGERTSETWLNTSQQVIYTASYGYDAAGQLTSESDGNSSYANTYDAGGRLTQQVVTYPGLSGSALVTLTSSYNGFNDRTGFSDSLGGTATFGFDGDHQLTSAQLTVSGVGANVALTYDSLNRLSTTTRTLVGGTGGHTITGTNTYDTAGRLTGLLYRDTTANTQLANYTYGYDAANDVTSYTGPEGNLTYTYDHTLQLTRASGTVNGQPYSASYSYDLNGNRTMTGYQTGTGNELLNDGTYAYTYDHAGNMLTRTDSSGNVWTYTWNYHNRLTEVVEKNSSQQVLQDEKFTYDVENRLIQVMSLGVTQRWTVYDGANPYMDLNASGQVTMRYLTNPQALDQFLARVDPSGSVGWYLTDRLGSVRQVVSGAGSVLDQVTYDAYGNILSETNWANGDRFKYAAVEYDPIQAAYHVGARWYGPGPGRFASQDPAGFAAGDTDLYRYVDNGPTNGTDPTGLVVREITVKSRYGPEAGKQGAFLWGVNFWLDQDADATFGGWILQHVLLTISIRQNKNTVDYWEAFRVDRKRDTPHSLPIDPPTVGAFRVAGINAAGKFADDWFGILMQEEKNAFQFKGDVYYLDKMGGKDLPPYFKVGQVSWARGVPATWTKGHEKDLADLLKRYQAIGPVKHTISTSWQPGQALTTIESHTP
jgi:RHS repeat-associated protein